MVRIKFNEFCEKYKHTKEHIPKSVSRQLANYRWLFTAILNYRDLHELAADDLRRLTEDRATYQGKKRGTGLNNLESAFLFKT